jgi:uncharacterized protein with ParB-like and HNH nuclease domain
LSSSLSGEEIIASVDKKITSVRTQSLDFSFNELADMYRDEELVINPDFQRLFRWTEGAQSRFVESLILELPVPPIFLIEREDRVYELIDGLQRFSSYLHFRGVLRKEGKLEEPLKLTECDIVPELNGRTQRELPRALDIKLKRSYVRAEILRKESDPRLRYYMFKRLNTGGEQLSEQELRNATIRLLSNEFNQFIIDLSRQDDFEYCISTISEGQRSRRFDQELVLRFFAFKNAVKDYKHDVSDFLTEYMEAVSDPDVDQRRPFDYEREQATFRKTFATLRQAADIAGIGERVFGSVLPRATEPRGQFSVYHFEGLVLGLQSVLSQVDLSDREALERLGRAIREGKANPEFLRHTGAGKNDPNPLRERIAFFANAFQQALNGA